MRLRSLLFLFMLGFVVAASATDTRPYTAVIDANNLSTTGQVTWHIEDATHSIVRNAVTSSFAIGSSFDRLQDFLYVQAKSAEEADNPAVTTNGTRVDWKPRVEQSDVYGLSTTLASKAAATHIHPESDVTGLTADLAGKSAVGHTHVKANITDFTHTHPESEVTNLTTDLASKVATTRNISTSSPLGGGGALSGDLALTCSTCLVKVASGTSALTATAVASAACQTTVTTAASGALTSDVVTWDYASAPVAATDGRLVIHSWATANNVNFMRCNHTAASVTPTAITLNWKVVR